MTHQLFRAMRRDTANRPSCVPGFGTLLARIPRDIEPDGEGIVSPKTGGLSVNPDNILYVPLNLRNKPGFSVFVIAEPKLGESLSFRPDPSDAQHGFVEPSGRLPLADYQAALQNSAPEWKIVP